MLAEEVSQAEQDASSDALREYRAGFQRSLVRAGPPPPERGLRFPRGGGGRRSVHGSLRRLPRGRGQAPSDATCHVMQGFLSQAPRAVGRRRRDDAADPAHGFWLSFRVVAAAWGRGDRAGSEGGWLGNES